MRLNNIFFVTQIIDRISGGLAVKKISVGWLSSSDSYMNRTITGIFVSRQGNIYFIIQFVDS
jgi:hypothetical protein